MLNVGAKLVSVTAEFSVIVPALFTVPDPAISAPELVFCRLKFAPELLFNVPEMVKSANDTVPFQLIVPLFSQVRLKTVELVLSIVVVTPEFVVSVPVPPIVPTLQVAAVVTVILSLPCKVPPATVRLAMLKALPVLRVVVPPLIVISLMLVIFVPSIVFVPLDAVRAPKLVTPVALNVFVPLVKVVAPVIV